jgi:CBS domain-containing protein
MFSIVGSEGFHTAYVPGKFRERKVDPIQKIPHLDLMGKSSQNPQPSFSQSFSKHRHSGIQAYEDVDALLQSGKPTLLAQDVMFSPVVTLSPDTKLLQAQDLIQQRRFRHIPIATLDGNVVGILSDRDVLRALASPAVSHIPSSVNVVQSSVHHFMNQPVLVAKPETEIRAIVRVMFEEHIGAMPIVSDTGQLVGIITRSDILRVLIAHPDFDQWV